MSPTVTNGNMSWGANLVAFICSICISLYADGSGEISERRSKVVVSLIVIVGVMITATCFAWFVKEDLRRVNWKKSKVEKE